MFGLHMSIFYIGLMSIQIKLRSIIETTVAICFLSLVSTQLIGSETDYSVSSIKSELLKESVAVIREHQININIIDSKRYNRSEKFVVTILNPKGRYLSNFVTYYDEETSIKELTAIVYDKNGLEIDRFKKKNFSDYNIGGDGVSITNTRVKQLEYNIVEYPVTFEFVSESKSANTGFIPSWDLAYGYNVGIEFSGYKLIKNQEMAMRHEVSEGILNLPIDFIETHDYIQIASSDIAPIRREDLCPDINKLYPRLKVALNEFNLHGHVGVSDDWSAFGLWYYNSFLNRDYQLDPEIIRTIKQSTAHVTSPLERARLVYKYVQDNTRYISIQLGIGGWKPTPAQEVHNHGYGDCKGLTHYTRALLNAVDVVSHVAIVYAGDDKRNVSRTFPSMQGNHVILALPSENDTTWLECTSQTAPFGYIGSFTDDRDVLLVSEKGGEIVHTPTYGHDENVRRVMTKFKLDENGTLVGGVDIDNSGIYIARAELYKTQDDSRVEEYFLQRYRHLNRASLSDLHTVFNRDSIQLIESFNIEVEEYSQKINEEMLFELIAIRSPSLNLSKYKKRELPFEIRNGSTSVVKGEMELPKGWKVSSSVEKSALIESEAGTYSLDISYDDKNFYFTRKLVTYDGMYGAEDYESYRKFLRSVRKKDQIKILLSK